MDTPAASRLLFIDNIRWVMIMLVLSMHAAVTYGGHGSWYVKEPAKLGVLQDLTFLTYQELLQSFFMGFLFFIAGYFVPGSYDKKGAARFLRDRAYRLGLPSLFFMLVIQPLTCYYVAGVWDTSAGFFADYQDYILHGRFLSGSGPLWFCVALLFFSSVYTGWRSLVPPSTRLERPKAFPRTIVLVTLIGLTAIATFVVRVSWPMGTSFYNMQFCYFAEYIVFFVGGILAYRNGWLSALPAAISRRWGFAGLFGGLIVWLLDIFLGGGPRNGAFYDGGWHWQSLGMSLQDALAGIGISLGLLGLFRTRFNRQGRWARFFSDNAFAVYVFHTPILIAITRGMTGLHWLPLGKFVLATFLCIAATYALSAGVFRRIPGLKKIL
ncbi:MAG TPA: acyltransferase family protein [Puia sp.]|jgi:fucose 4-O-acetylase-like acetyltransferase|nr:acyltransferase family protein [Puia sp.]